MAYDLIIANGTVVSPNGQEIADVAIRGETHRRYRPGLAVSGEAAPSSTPWQVRDSRRYRRPCASGTAVLRDSFERRLADRHAGRGARRHHHGDRLRHPVWHAVAGRRVSRLAGASQTEGLCRLLFPHGHHELGPAWSRMPTMVARLSHLQGVHDLCLRRLAGRRPGHLQHARGRQAAWGDAARPCGIMPRCSTN